MSLEFEIWYEELNRILTDAGHRTADQDTAYEDFQLDITPQESSNKFIEEWES